MMSYEMFLQHADRVAALANVDLLVCDEGHRLKNLGIKTTTLLSKLPARRRILLTGTPVQNNLNELWSLAEFCAPGVLADSQEEFRLRIANPLSLARRPVDPLADEGGWEDEEAEEENANVIEAARRLTTAVRKFMLRRTADAVCRRLPGKSEFTFLPGLQSTEPRWCYFAAANMSLSVMMLIYFCPTKGMLDRPEPPKEG
ncbi:unnamed protein product [Dibothriocephalus latus]|uniref:Helicase ATP-binding domain-containing protein n=1 Tax=Dibothriocephalus latus TaxID=60516 RepID=A0A3P6PS67_DIBLA|nr:unnamed protein product [Dibothriocephalus latus]